MLNNDFINGLIGGFVGTIISHPVDTVKTRIQSNKFNTIINAIKAGKLYSGLTPPLIGIMMEKSIVFGFYEKSKEYGFNNFTSGTIAGLISTLIVTPIDRLKIHFQNNEKFLINKNLYKGFLPTIFRETPGFGIYFTTYNYLNTNYNNSKSLVNNFIYGSLSGLSAWLFIYPADLIKTQYQANQTKLKDIIINIWSKNNINNNQIKGFLNFYSGFSLAIMRALPLHGGVFLGYEVSKKYL